MKLLVPFRMPRMLSIRLAARHSPIAATIGMPPATAASNAIDRPCFRASSKSSGPCSASRALLAVTTSFPFSKSSIIIDRAGSRPPTSNAATEIDGSREISRISDEIFQPGTGTLRAFATSFTTARSTTIRRPACLSIWSADSTSRRTTPDPTVPMPTTPTRTGSVIQMHNSLREWTLIVMSVASTGKNTPVALGRGGAVPC